jgi:hypothetical protein
MKTYCLITQKQSKYLLSCDNITWLDIPHLGT